MAPSLDSAGFIHTEAANQLVKYTVNTQMSTHAGSHPTWLSWLPEKRLLGQLRRYRAISVESGPNELLGYFSLFTLVLSVVASPSQPVFWGRGTYLRQAARSASRAFSVLFVADPLLPRARGPTWA